MRRFAACGFAFEQASRRSLQGDYGAVFQCRFVHLYILLDKGRIIGRGFKVKRDDLVAYVRKL